jgi:RHS repeat-associated protein
MIQQEKSHIENTYSWDGSKRRRRVLDQIGQQLSEERYLGDLVTENDLPSLILHADGYVDVSGMQPLFTYHLKDHLGNVRIVMQAGGSSGTLKQSNDYYPFGMAYTKNAADSEEESFARENKYKYNGKEEQPMPGKWLDYGARFYDAQLGRWHSVDPLAEKYYPISPYTYVANNPILRIDPDGRDIWEVNDQGKIVNRIKDKTQDAFFMVAKDADGDYQRTYTTNADGENEYNSVTFEYGTVESQRTIAINSKSSYDVYSVRGDENGTELFNFLSQNVTGSPSKVEFSQAMTGIAGDKGLNFITTSHEMRKESGMTYLLNGQLLNGYTLRELNHSQPVGMTPSGSDLPGRISGDLGFAKEVKNILKAEGRKIPMFHIYHVPSRTKIPYSQ